MKRADIEKSVDTSSILQQEAWQEEEYSFSSRIIVFHSRSVHTFFLDTKAVHNSRDDEASATLTPTAHPVDCFLREIRLLPSHKSLHFP
jgi:hypothetical protein